MATAQPVQPVDISALILLFARGVIATLDLWPALTIAVREQWGGRDSADKKTWIASVLIDEFEQRFSPATPDDLPLDEEEIEDLLQQIMSDEFDANIEDGSVEAVAADTVKLWKALVQDVKAAEGVVEEMERRAAKAQKGANIQATKGQGTEGLSDDEDDDDDESDDGDEDDSMNGDEAPQLVESAPRERQEKVIDDDGFELVQKKGRR